MDQINLPQPLVDALDVLRNTAGWERFSTALREHLEEVERQRLLWQEHTHNMANGMANVERNLQRAEATIEQLRAAQRRPQPQEGGLPPPPPPPAGLADRLSKIVKDPGEFDGTKGKTFEEWWTKVQIDRKSVV